jgi:hypothetical protein
MVMPQEVVDAGRAQADAYKKPDAARPKNAHDTQPIHIVSQTAPNGRARRGAPRTKKSPRRVAGAIHIG